MSSYRLDKLFAPRSVAVVGASPRQTSSGRAVLANLRQAGFAGPIHLVNPHYDEIEGVRAVKSYDDLPETPDVAAIAVPAAAVPGAVAAAAAKGTAAAIIVTAGLGHGPGSLEAQCEQTARAAGMRLVGPNCLGVLVPGSHLNASFAAASPPAGDLALISQSGAIAAGLVQWASVRSIGFSAVVSLGDSIDVDFADLLDFFAMDRDTRAILLYIESIREARKFMSAARAASRVKPVVVIKSGRQALGAKAALTHTGALAGSDAVYDAAFRRAGLLRVLDLDELFAAAETLGHVNKLAGPRLAILTNGGGVGVLAVDRLADLGGELAGISPETFRKLDAALPPIWSRANPVDIAGDADAARYTAALENLLDDSANDAVLTMNVPTALASATDAAKAVIAATGQHRKNKNTAAKPVFALWVGEEGEASAAFEAAGIPSYATEVGGDQRFHVSRPLPAVARHSYGDAAEHAAGLRTGPRSGAPGAGRRARGQSHLARSGRTVARAFSLPNSGHARGAGARSRRSGRGGAALSRKGHAGRAQDSVARHRPQIGSRRRAARSR